MDSKTEQIPIDGLDADITQRLIELRRRDDFLRKLWSNPQGDDIDSQVYRKYPVLQERQAHPLRLGEKGSTLAEGVEFYTRVTGAYNNPDTDPLIRMTVLRSGDGHKYGSTSLIARVEEVHNPHGVSLLDPNKGTVGAEVELLQGADLYFIPKQK